MLNIESRHLWRSVKISVASRHDVVEDVIDKYCSAGAGAAKELAVETGNDLNEDHIILLATKFKKLKKLRLVAYRG